MNEVLEFKYIEKKEITHDTFIYVYEIPQNLTLGINLGQHIAIEYKKFNKAHTLNPQSVLMESQYPGSTHPLHTSLLKED
jgi:hypothetical protein